MYKNELRNRKNSYLYLLNNPCSFILTLLIEIHIFPKTNTKIETQTCSERNIEIYVSTTNTFFDNKPIVVIYLQDSINLSFSKESNLFV